MDAPVLNRAMKQRRAAVRKLTEQTKKLVFKFDALDIDHLVLLSEEEGQRGVDRKQVDSIKGAYFANPNKEPLLSQFVVLDKHISPKAALTLYRAGTLRVGVTGGQHNLIAIREINSADPAFFRENNPAALIISGKLYTLGGITAFAAVLEAAKKEDEASVQGSLKVFIV